MTQRDELLRTLFDSKEVVLANIKKSQAVLSYQEMLDLAELFEGWAMHENTSQKQSAEFVGWSEGLREMAIKVGEGWSPGVVEPLPALTFVARLMRK